MKKTMAVAVALVLGLAFSAYAAETTVKETVKTKGDKTVETKTVKTPEGTAKQKVTTTDTAIKTDTKVKTDGVKIEKKTTETEGKVAGTTKVDVKNGVIKDLKVDWTYQMEGGDYVITYNIKEHTNPALIKELNITPDQAKMLENCKGRIVSTSPYTAMDVQNNFRSFIVNDIKTSLMNKRGN
ncbi:MAG TPA: hypothetical protein PLZ86_05855 [bacterium]|nr:hypothetical protein [bacterium]